ncbi:type II CAAX prenyl endopeptidase Rce1 family protein [Frateuria sp. GZRR35]|uniref:CPBP family glutamic-type intramembrane protease n=1 Tax=Frateuria sp. GZRR35 TaxID=3351536 RepID=UPI003EDC8BFD
MDFANLASLMLAAWLLLGEPLLGRWSHRRLLAALAAGQPGARLRFYRSWTGMAWALAFVTALVVLAQGWSPGEVGLRWPHIGDVGRGFVDGMTGALIAGAAVGIVLSRRKRSAAPRVAGGDKVLRMLPHNRAERWGFSALAVTAGLTEEWIWRGFAAAALHAAWPQLAMLPTVVVLALAFGWAHFYQGLGGMLATALLGGLLGWLYLSSGSLLLPMLLHVLIDLRALLVPVGTGASNPQTDVQTSMHHRGNP